MYCTVNIKKEIDLTEEELSDAAMKASVVSNDIYEQWEKDSPIDQLHLQTEAANCPKLHSKYSNLLRKETKKLNTIEAYYSLLDKRLYNLYTNTGPQQGNMDEIKKLPSGKVLKADYEKYVQGDLDHIEWKLKVETQKSRVKFLDSVLYEIGRRHYHITNIFNEKKYNKGE